MLFFFYLPCRLDRRDLPPCRGGNRPIERTALRPSQQPPVTCRERDQRLPDLTASSQNFEHEHQTAGGSSSISMSSSSSTNLGLCGRWPWGGGGHAAGADADPRWANTSEDNNTSNEDESEAFTSGVRRIWQRPAAEGSLCKDLPRLAGRITIRTRRCVPEFVVQIFALLLLRGLCSCSLGGYLTRLWL